MLCVFREKARNDAFEKQKSSLNKLVSRCVPVVHETFNDPWSEFWLFFYIYELHGKPPINGIVSLLLQDIDNIPPRWWTRFGCHAKIQYSWEESIFHQGSKCGIEKAQVENHHGLSWPVGELGNGGDGSSSWDWHFIVLCVILCPLQWRFKMRARK